MLKTERTWRIAQKEENGYCCYRIPGILPTADGALLLCCEERALGTGDWGDIDVAVFRMNEDGKCRKILEIGQSRLPPDGSLRTYHNPVLVPDTNGRVHLIYHLNYARAFVISNTDHGRTWGMAREITAAFQAFDYAWNVCASGPGHGVCMDNGRLADCEHLAGKRRDAWHDPFPCSLDGGVHFQRRSGKDMASRRIGAGCMHIERQRNRRGAASRWQAFAEPQKHFDLMNAAETSFFIYNFPAFSGFSLSPDVLDEMCRCQYLAGVKFTASDFFQLERMKHAHPELAIWNSYDEMLLSGLSAGADGGIGSTYNVLCPIIHRVYDAFKAGNSAQALHCQHIRQ